ncbi:hypothetical protein AAFN85_02460 [Mucilaginibacter sp. CAU 1740]|uniref:hypothetical protein n=1 Tax=Mucilaginibacter sp. CAU 1740 TaxID=3140365 RepID=UPI00325A89CE
MRYLLIFILILTIGIVKGQPLADLKANRSKAERIILNDNDFKAMMLFHETHLTNKEKFKLVVAVQAEAEKYTPPVLYTMSMVLYMSKRYNDACFWFYVAQLRTQYDINRSVDKTVSAADLDGPIGRYINQYAYEHLDSLEMILPEVIDYVNDNDEEYDQRWINVFRPGNGIREEDVDKLSVDKSQWPAIKKGTVDVYYTDFKEFIAKLKQQQHPQQGQ